mmetsp:Transcript_31097/g.60609  ORF Transcript_31097/g.60609 Transcript_31097/m.60609 type:complete len:297 (-) Transcript_31097:665-1555(-)
MWIALLSTFSVFRPFEDCLSWPEGISSKFARLTPLCCCFCADRIECREGVASGSNGSVESKGDMSGFAEKDVAVGIGVMVSRTPKEGAGVVGGGYTLLEEETAEGTARWSLLLCRNEEGAVVLLDRILFSVVRSCCSASWEISAKKVSMLLSALTCCWGGGWTRETEFGVNKLPLLALFAAKLVNCCTLRCGTFGFPDSEFLLCSALLVSCALCCSTLSCSTRLSLADIVSCRNLSFCLAWREKSSFCSSISCRRRHLESSAAAKAVTALDFSASSCLARTSALLRNWVISAAEVW